MGIAFSTVAAGVLCYSIVKYVVNTLSDLKHTWNNSDCSGRFHLWLLSFQWSFACSTCYCECAIVVYLHILECRPWLKILISGCFLMCENQTFSPSDDKVRRRGYISLGYWVSSPFIVVLLCSHSVEKLSSTEIGPSGNKGNKGSNRGHSRMMKQGKLH
jgi:hypothetical protein